MSVEIKIPDENKTWIQKATETLEGVSKLTLGAVFVGVPVLAVAARLSADLATTGNTLPYAVGGLLAVGVASALLSAPGAFAVRVTSQHRNEASSKLHFATDAVSRQLQLLGYDMSLEVGGKNTEAQVKILNNQIVKVSGEVLAATQGMGHSYRDVLGTAYVLGNEAKRTDLSLMSAAEGLLAGLQIIKNDPTAMVNPQVAIHAVKERDTARIQRDDSGLSLG
jgi:hypothetical protein